MDEPKLRGLTIFLAKVGLEAPKAAIKEIAALKAFNVKDENGPLGTLYVQIRAAHAPDWASFFAPQITPNVLGRANSTSAVLHVVVDGRAFLLTFGQGRYLVEPTCYEERFGLRVTLNSIGENRVRSMDKHSLDTVGRHSRVQLSKESVPSDFGLDIERDLLRAITGSPLDEILGKTLSGFDSLHALVRVDLASLKDLLSAYYGQYIKDTYKKTFPWVDQIAEVKDKALRESLDARLVDVITKKQWDKCWLAVPEPIDWSGIAGFRHRRGARYAVTHDINFEAFIADNGLKPAEVTIDALTNKQIIAEDGEGKEKHAWTVYRCIYSEIAFAKSTYLLSDGKWYKVAPSFVEQVDQDFAKIPMCELKLPEYGEETEGAYNERVAAGGTATYALLDRKLVAIGGGYSRIEFCDLLTRKNDIIHVKRYGGSSVLSHLFSQGTVSGQLFVSDAGFRKAVNKHLPDSHKLANTVARPDVTKYRVVFAIVMSDQKATLSLPFFSRLNARQASQTLGGYGYKVALLRISTTAAAIKTKKYKIKKARAA